MHQHHAIKWWTHLCVIYHMLCAIVGLHGTKPLEEIVPNDAALRLCRTTQLEIFGLCGNKDAAAWVQTAVRLQSGGKTAEIIWTNPMQKKVR